MNDFDPRIIAALISAIVTVFMFIASSIVKSIWEKHFHNFKLKADHKYEQRKKIKEAISKHKVRLMDSSESLNHRLWNFSDNCDKRWHKLRDDKTINELYYLESFTYRFLSFFAWCRKIEKEMVYLDSTISDSEDLEFIKYLKMFPQMFCDTALFNGHEYDASHDTDHFFKDDFLHMVDSLITDEGVITYSEFKRKSHNAEYTKMISYIDGISDERACLKWHSLSLFHFVLMAFLTKFGYDFQQTSKDKLKLLSSKVPENILANNLSEILERNHLNKTREMKSVLKVVKSA
ncbi:hypothetical protein [Pseudoalteromonas ruthenica]|uniref:hypothetical protein n=1 Tax=Pseudoalteromonas ruthenica TaxID=151081 RepID=UPI00110AD3DE|nr:hypothetical protein [Pseudoalteromonas ruthenica]TMO88103.1 hypothetical protein CWC12_07875 [Pseudoalteromonas ruthenica]TMP24040.1 hypothetical protein CWC06_07045 [Pseudoalteromonas ruthenica]